MGLTWHSAGPGILWRWMQAGLRTVSPNDRTENNHLCGCRNVTHPVHTAHLLEPLLRGRPLHIWKAYSIRKMNSQNSSLWLVVSPSNQRLTPCQGSSSPFFSSWLWTWSCFLQGKVRTEARREGCAWCGSIIISVCTGSQQEGANLWTGSESNDFADRGHYPTTSAF